MSWAEVKKINSNFAKESLNFNDYIIDIEKNGVKSYVLDVANEDLFLDLLANSTEVYTNTKIHYTILDRLTDTEVDTMLSGSAAGTRLNNFYNTNIFTVGTINDILANLTIAKCNKLDAIILNGFIRYLTLHTSGTSGVGDWLSLVYNVPELSLYLSLESILSDTTLWSETIMTNEPLRVGICSSTIGVNFASASLTGDVFNQYIQTIAGAAATAKELWNALYANNRLNDFWDNSTAAGYTFDSANAFLELMYHPYAFASLCGNTNACTVLGQHTDNYDILFDAWVTSGNSESTLNSIKLSLQTLQTLVGIMPAKSHNIYTIENALTTLNNTILDVQSMNSKADTLAANFEAIKSSSVAWPGIFASPTAVNKILSNKNVFKLLLESEGFSTCMAADSPVMTTICNNADFLAVLIVSHIGMQKVKANASAWLIFNTLDVETRLGSNTNCLNAMKASTNYTTITGSCSGYGYTIYGNYNHTGDVFMFTVTNTSATTLVQRLYNATYEDAATRGYYVNKLCTGSRVAKYVGYYDSYSGGGAGSGSGTASAVVFKLY